MRTDSPFPPPEGGAESDAIEAVRAQRLPDSLRPALEAYDETVGERDRFLWRWLYRLFPEFTLSCIDGERSRRAREAKLLASMFVALADDVAEKRDDRSTFDEMAKVPFDHRSVDPARPGVDGEALGLQERLWAQFESRLEGSPRLDEFATVLAFDVEQVLTAIVYSSLANRHLELVSMEELWTYDVHNMMVFAYADVDLANAPSFDGGELADLRRVLTHSQRMARIGNWLTTWKRELAEGDCLSGVVVSALESAVVSTDDLRAVREDPSPSTVDPVARAIESSDVQAEFREQWTDEYAAARRLGAAIDSVDVEAYLEGFETVLRYHLASEGLK